MDGGKSLSQLHRDYVDNCIQKGEPYANYLMFSRIFNYEYNIAFFSPKKDQCEDCMAFKVASDEEKISLKDDYENHLKEKELSRREKENDKNNSDEGTIVAVYDLQAVLQCPKGDVSTFYYTCKLNVFNLTVYEIKTHTAKCFMWDESEANRGVCEIVSCILSCKVKFCKDDLPVILWSDGCAYQNRNSTLSNALLHHAKKHNKTITQNYLEPGHTQMECDSVHSLIERKLKNKKILITYDYVRITREARQKPLPFEARYMTHDMFKKYDDKDLIIYQSIRPGRSVIDPTVNNLRVLHYSPNSRIGYKLQFHDEMMELPQRSRDSQNCKDATRLFPARLKITQLKYDHLQEIKTTLDAEVHHFYNNLPH
nr:unnamed protein product [Callosobruchus analis]